MASLHFKYSAMNSGKSSTLLQIAYNYEELGMKVKLFTFAGDNRYGVGKISSRIGLQRDADLFDADTNFVELVAGRNYDCILIDEAQFMTEDNACQLCTIVDELNIPVMCFGLRTDFKGNLFPGSGILLGVADHIEEIKNMCHCGKKATMNMRVDEHGNKVTEGPQVEIGGNDRYAAVCRKHFR